MYIGTITIAKGSKRVQKNVFLNKNECRKEVENGI